MTRKLIAGTLIALAGSATAQTELLLWVQPSTDSATVGDVVTWTLYAELVNLPPGLTILATVSDIGFDLSFGTESDIVISNNMFAPAFDSTFFGPADDGQVVGTEILGAMGANTLPPLNNPGGPDSSNPLVIYTLDTLITDDTPRSIAAYPTIHGQFSGAYEGTPFPYVFFYQNPNGTPGTVPFGLLPLFAYPRLDIVPIPAPASVAPIGLGAIAGVRRRR